jgi:hypothetical protein
MSDNWVVVRRWRYTVGRSVGWITEERSGGVAFFVIWLYEDEVWSGYRFVLRDVNYSLFPRFIGRLVAIAQGTGGESRLWLMVEERGVRTRYWVLYWRMRDGAFRRFLRIRTTSPEYNVV